MIIREIHIIEFGGLKDKHITLGEGMNLLCGENESGKSTVMLFIKYMLYGLPRKTAGNTERDRSVSRDGKTASGSMAFEVGGKKYSVERHFKGARGSDSFKLFDIDGGEEMAIECQPGEHFLGVPREVFESSAAIGQLKAGDINGEKAAGAIENIMVSADEAVDTAKVIATLDKIRTEYRHKNGAGGKLYHSDMELAEQRERLRTATERAATLREQEKKLAEKEKEEELCESELKKADAIYEKIRQVYIIRQFDRLHEEEKKLADISREESEFIAKTPDFSPTRATGESLRRLVLECESAKRAVNDAKNNLESAKALRGDEALAAEGEKLSFMGGRDKALNEIKSLESQKKKMLFGAISMLLLAVGAAGGYFALLKTVKNIPLILAAVPLFLCLGVIFAVSMSKSQKKLKAALGGYGSLGELEAHLSECEENVRLCADKKVAISKAEGLLEGAETRLAELLAALRSEMTALGGNVDAPLSEEISKLLEKINAYCERIETFEKKKSELTHTVKAMSAPIAEYDEAKLREEMDIDMDSVNEKFVSEITMKRKFYSTKLDAIRQSLRLMNNTVIQLRANFIDPLELSDRVAALEEEAKRDREFYEALVLAMESIESAGEKMQSSITPEIGKRASDMMSIVSGGRYSEVCTGKKLVPAVIERGIPVSAELLSGGTKDVLYTVLRLSLMIQIFGEELPPLLMDESLCQLDDTRAEKMLMLLDSLKGLGLQILLFSCHTREKNICAQSGIEHEIIEL